jgi:Na+-transporting NADH:ubiquinone oxidoreductase subunit C
MKKESKVYSVLFTFGITFVLVALLALANESTKEPIARNNELFFRRAVLFAMNIPYDRIDQVFDLYSKTVTERTTDQGILYQAVQDGETVFAMKFAGNGLWGTITGIVAISEDASRIVGIDFVEQNETPGLGGRIDDLWFKEQFRGEAIPEGRITMLRSAGRLGDPDSDNAAVDAVTGATLTSESVEKILNQYLHTLQNLVREGKN